MQVGAPLVALTTIVVAFLISALRGPAPVVSAARATPPAVSSLLIAAPPVFRPAAITAAAPVLPAAPASSSVPLAYFANTNEAPSAGFAELERLRSLSHYVDSTLAADQSTRGVLAASGGRAVSSALPVAY